MVSYYYFAQAATNVMLDMPFDEFFERFLSGDGESDTVRISDHTVLSRRHIALGQSGEICSGCFCSIVSIPLPDCRAKFLNGSETLPTIVGPSLACQTTADHLRLLFSTDASSATVGPNFTMAVKHYPRSSDRVWHVRLPPITSDYYFLPTQVLPLARFYVRFCC